MSWGIELAERGRVPKPALRLGIRAFFAAALRGLERVHFSA